MKGIQKYSGTEAGNLSLGQTGFKQLDGATNNTTAKIVAIKCLLGSAFVSADSDIGDDLGGGTSDGSGTAMISGDIIWGCFSKVRTYTSAKTVLVYYG